jgi:transcriptional regulator with XRE-family HTH domain
VHPTDKRLNQPGGLAERLYRMRKDARLTGDQLAEHLGWGTGTGRTKVSKIENGRQLPTPDDIRAWAAAAGHPEAARNLLDMLADAQAAHRQWRGQLRGGHAPVQQDLDRRTKTATRFRNAETVIIPGLLQTAGYARSIMQETADVWGTTDIDAAVGARMQRQEILYDTSKTFEFVITEAALRLLPCPPQVMSGQLVKLLSLDLPNVTLGIIPMGVQLRMPLINSFLLLDDVVIIESYGSENIGGEDESAVYAQVFDHLMAEAVTGDEARQLITAAAASLRDLRG